MRLISQDGMIDVNYDNGSIVVGFIGDGSGAVISYYDHSHRDKATVLGKYGSKPKALKVMEMLREQYMKLGMIKILASGTCEYMDKSLKKEEKMDIYTDYCRKHCFKFPDDEEVEV